MARVFLDTYALIEVMLSSESHREVSLGDGSTLMGNLAETYYVLRTQYSAEAAEKAYGIISKLVVAVSAPTVRSAMVFREEFNKKNRRHALSYADAIGYTYARENGLDFVTGDDAFNGLDGVRFIK
ncbi:MAG: PIN domain-containing protein [Candidatus Micrarchaeia archaeon]|jgi:predicted nucleic acid-binding protein